MSENERPNRRREPRHDVELEVDYAADGTFLYALATDISTMGIFLRTEHPLAVGTPVSMRFTPTLEATGNEAAEDERFASVLAPNVDLTPIELQGSVAWNTLASDETPDPGMGIAFGSLEPATRARLEALVRAVAIVDL